MPQLPLSHYVGSGQPACMSRGTELTGTCVCNQGTLAACKEQTPSLTVTFIQAEPINCSRCDAMQSSTQERQYDKDQVHSEVCPGSGITHPANEEIPCIAR